MIATPAPFSRVWSMPSADTFSIPPIKALLKRWVVPGLVVVDPFARNSTLATWRNDLNPATDAHFHMEAGAFCEHLQSQGVKADVVLFDPPYSPRQIAECYQSVGKVVTTRDTQNARLYAEVRRGLDAILKPGGFAISFGWNSSGFGKAYERLETLMVCHGGAHNDTIVVVDQKTQAGLF